MKLKFDHFFRLIDETAIVEHSTGGVPNIEEGYSLDDVARALIVCLKFRNDEQKMAKVFPRLFAYTEMAADQKGFLNDLEKNGKWKQTEMTGGEHFGRIMVALAELGWGGVVVEPYRSKARKLFEHNQQYTLESPYARVWAQMILAWSYRLRAENENGGDVGKLYVETLASRLVEMYRSQEKDNWKWFEEVVSYDNGRLPMALLGAFEVIKKEEYLSVAKDSLEFLTNKIDDGKTGYFIFPGNRGWWRKGEEINVFDQQPVEAGSMVEVYAKAYGITGGGKYASLAKKAWEWYFGRNIRGESLIDEVGGGVADGLSEKEVSKNQGAEAILSFLLAADALRGVGLLE